MGKITTEKKTAARELHNQVTGKFFVHDRISQFLVITVTLTPDEGTSYISVR